MGTTERYQQVRAQVDEACAAAQRNPEDVLLMAVSKTVDLPEVAKAIEGGCHDFGENRPEELVRKQHAFPGERWHFIGNIQSRRIPEIVASATLIHSVCKVSHMVKINNAAARLGKVQYVLLEVNVSGEKSKSGLAPVQVYGAMVAAADMQNLKIVGLMTMAPQGDPQAIEQTFAGLRALRDHVVAKCAKDGMHVNLSELSMGMSEDWPVAVGYGSTIIRVGRAIFSDSFA